MKHSSDHRPSAGDTEAPPDATEQDLKATADSIRTDLSRLAAIEDEKNTLEGEDPAVDRLSDEAVKLADRISRETRAERQLSEELG
jgi:hypothetical protein